MNPAQDFNAFSPFMDRALELAREASEAGEVPVGAVLSLGDHILAEASNSTIRLQDPTAHAEILAIREAARALENYRFPSGTTLHVTLEPCAMCAGAIVWARIDRVVISLRDPKAGAAGSLLEVIPNPKLNHRPEVEFGPGETASRELLQEFFRSRRVKT